MSRSTVQLAARLATHQPFNLQPIGRWYLVALLSVDEGVLPGPVSHLQPKLYYQHLLDFDPPAAAPAMLAVMGLDVFHQELADKSEGEQSIDVPSCPSASQFASRRASPSPAAAGSSTSGYKSTYSSSVSSPTNSSSEGTPGTPSTSGSSSDASCTAKGKGQCSTAVAS